MTQSPFEPDYATAPSETLRETMISLGFDEHEFGRLTRLGSEEICQFTHGEASITAEIALRLEKATRVPARFWNDLELQYRECRKRLGMDDKRSG